MPLQSELAEVQEALARRDAAALWEKTRSADRDVRKAAKRALYLLRARGVETGDPPAATAHEEGLTTAASEDGESCQNRKPLHGVSLRGKVGLARL